MKYTVEAFWDAEAKVWVASSENIPGLVTEADNLELLTTKLKNIVPELLLLNKTYTNNRRTSYLPDRLSR
jgi:hypothetical protein